MVLCFVVLNVAVAKKNQTFVVAAGPPAVYAKNECFGFAIGLVIVAGGYGAGAISGGAFNPAVAVGIEVAAKRQGFVRQLFSPTYIFFEFAGAALAALAFR